MKPAAKKAMTILSKTPMPAIVIVVFVLGYTFKGMVGTTPRAASTAAVEESSEQAGEEDWTCSMHPHIHLPKPGKCPICGMDLIPVAGTTQTKAAKKKAKEPKYACSMFCVPPMSRPPIPASRPPASPGC